MSSTKLDENSPWQAAMRKQRRQARMTFAVALLVPLVVIFLMWMFAPAGRIFRWITIVLILMFVPAPFMLLRAWRQHRRFSELVPKHAGIVCPKCIQPLVEVPDGRNQYQCEKCARRYDANELRRFWDLAVHDPMAAARQWVERDGGAKTFRNKLARHLMQLNKTPRGIIVSNAVIWIGMGVALATLTGKNWILGAFTYVHMMLFMTGMMLMGASRKMRLGDTRHCVKCDYQQPPQAAASERCPECGSNWNEIGGLVHGRLTRRPHLLVIGAVLFIIGIAAIASPVFMRGWQSQLMPTSTLITQVINERGFTMDEWSVLNTRTLTPAQELRLAQGLIDKRKERGWLPRDDDNWLVAQINAGKMPAELRDRYYREMLDLELKAPAKAKVGEPISLSVIGTYRGASSNNPSATVYVGGYFINDATEPLNRQVGPLGGIMLDPDKAKQSRERLQATFVAEVSGPFRVRLEVWIVALPFGQGPVIQWQANDSPVIPPNAAWHEKRVIEHVIEVEP